tara:strand:- start:81 stop:452 length:372 start_codon:yes stop_codon:yes gene_type:complete
VDKTNSFNQKVYSTVSKIPYGEIATYGQIADLIYEYGHARQVGWALRRLRLPSTIPWHRVINSKGEITMRLSRNGTDWMQKELLINEGIKFNLRMKIDIKKYIWKPKEITGRLEGNPLDFKDV